jgi:hypothetical protein
VKSEVSSGSSDGRKAVVRSICRSNIQDMGFGRGEEQRHLQGDETTRRRLLFSHSRAGFLTVLSGVADAIQKHTAALGKGDHPRACSSGAGGGPCAVVGRLGTGSTPASLPFQIIHRSCPNHTSPAPAPTSFASSLLPFTAYPLTVPLLSGARPSLFPSVCLPR